MLALIAVAAASAAIVPVTQPSKAFPQARGRRDIVGLVAPMTASLLLSNVPTLPSFGADLVALGERAEVCILYRGLNIIDQ